MRKLLPLLLALAGLGLGLGAGVLLRPNDVAAAASVANGPVETPAVDGEPAVPEGGDAETPSRHRAVEGSDDGDGHPEYVKLSNQFIIPVVENGRVASMVILSLSLEVAQGNTEAIFAMEPKLRDGLLQVLFDHANAGGFHGSFTDGANLIILRRALLEVSRKAAGDDVRDVLIADIARQDN